ncbi:hypothetical protein V5O48_014682 [Marasmius crinis-equi]|uniref:Delta 8-(E)-sphingolipid desaturase n=1 Tax=Marasmius crinis-equi TaxID=585013 RepID=A0ABR3EWL2_9AGAR
MKQRLTRSDIVFRILKGEHIIIYNRHVLRIPDFWLDSHPGGSLALLHFVGRDTTSEIEAFHSSDILTTVAKYSIGILESPEPWEPLLPPITSGWEYKNGGWCHQAQASQICPTEHDLIPPPSLLSLSAQSQHASEFKKLHQRITDAGLYETPYLTGYAPEFSRYCLLATLSFVAYRYQWWMTSAFLLGLFWHQTLFFAHDLGHMGVTHSWAMDRVIATFIGNFLNGLSIGWWVNNHNIHHLVTNHPSHDPDIEYLPFFAISPTFFSNLYSTFYSRILPFDDTSRILVSIQHKLFYVILALARVNLYRLSYAYLLNAARDRKRKRAGEWAFWLEILGIMGFWYWFGFGVLRGCLAAASWKTAVGYVLVSHVTTGPLHVQLALSHFSMSTKDLGPTESFVARQLRTTTDVICPDYLSFLHGGLHLQVTHHLFPRLPRHNLRRASEMVKEFAKDRGLTYAEFGFVEGNKEVVGVLRDVAGQVGLVGKVVREESRKAGSRPT